MKYMNQYIFKVLEIKEPVYSYSMDEVLYRLQNELDLFVNRKRIKYLTDVCSRVKDFLSTINESNKEERLLEIANYLGYFYILDSLDENLFKGMGTEEQSTIVEPKKPIGASPVGSLATNLTL